MIVDRYYYHQLNKCEQTIYKSFYHGVMEYKQIIPLPITGKISQDMFNRVFQAVTRDNPLVYFLNQSTCSIAQDAHGHSAICPQYFYSQEKIREYNQKIEDAVNKLAAQLLLTEGTDYEKEKKIHDWLCGNIKYDFQGTDMQDPVRVIAAHNILGVFAHHRAQCEGIAKAVKVLLNAVDIKCIVATGNANGNGQNGPHAWNIVSIDGRSYQLDVTWDIGGSERGISYDYFNVPDAIMGKDHKCDSVLPKCTDWSDNYFVKSNSTFQNRDQLLSYVKAVIDSGESAFYFQVSGDLNVVQASEELTGFIRKKITSGKIRIQTKLNEKVGTCWIHML